MASAGCIMTLILQQIISLAAQDKAECMPHEKLCEEGGGCVPVYSHCPVHCTWPTIHSCGDQISCYTELERCDGVQNCLNWNDELDCDAAPGDTSGIREIQPSIPLWPILLALSVILLCCSFGCYCLCKGNTWRVQMPVMNFVYLACALLFGIMICFAVSAKKAALNSWWNGSDQDSPASPATGQRVTRQNRPGGTGSITATRPSSSPEQRPLTSEVPQTTDPPPPYHHALLLSSPCNEEALPPSYESVITSNNMPPASK